jgi:hypothetical protein
MICIFLKENPEFLVKLAIEDLKLSKETLCTFKSVLEENSNLKKISFINCGITDDSLQPLIRGLEENKGAI